MQPVNPFGTSCSLMSEAPPPVQEKENDVVLNFTLSIPESMLLAFVKDKIQTALDQKNEVFFIGTSGPMQQGFNAWVARTFTAKRFTAEELNLVTVVPSIWEKTKTQVENELRVRQDLQAIEDERQWQGKADHVSRNLLSQGRKGKVFTTRQANFLLNAVNSIGK